VVESNVTFEQIAAKRRARMGVDTVAQRDEIRAAYQLASDLIEQRTVAGLTQTQLAQRAGITQGDLSRIEAGERMPSTRTLHRIVIALGADLRIIKRDPAA
jgi:DNA-binding XRE family transcriptional regulator